MESNYLAARPQNPDEDSGKFKATLKSCKIQPTKKSNRQPTNYEAPDLTISHYYQKNIARLFFKYCTEFGIRALKIRYNQRIVLEQTWYKKGDFIVFNFDQLDRHPFEDSFVCELLFNWVDSGEDFAAIYEFKLSQFQTKTELKHKMLPHYRPGKDLCHVFHQNFEMSYHLNVYQRDLLLDIENYKSNENLQKFSKLYKMFALALQIEDLENEKNLQKYEVSNVFITEENKIFGNSEYSSYSVPSTAEILRENSKDYMLCLIPMNRFDSVYIKDFDNIWANIKEHENGKIYFERKRPIKDFEMKRFHLKLVPNRYPIRACMLAVEQVNDQILPYFQDFQGLQFAVMRRMRQFTGGDFEWIDKNVAENEEQKQAIRQIVNCSAYPSPYIVFGPPGTGKTSTLVEAVTQILLLKPDSHILVLAQSNSACDEITIRLLKSTSRSKILRYYSAKYGERCQHFSDKLRSISNFRNKKLNQMPSYEEFYHFKVVVMTLVSSTRFALAGIKSGHFDYIFIDECASSIEPECLIPITAFAFQESTKVFSQIVLLGDHKQLGPIINSKFALDLCLGESLMERMMKLVQYSKKNPKYVTQLLDNFRSHEAILQFSNEHFYDGELRAKADPKVADFALDWNYLPNKDFPVMLHAVLDPCEQEKEGFSWFNDGELRYVQKYVMELLRNGINRTDRVEQRDIGIVSPYKAQEVKLKNMFRNQSWIEIGTAEYFQGREKKIIVITTVRSGTSVGFLKDEKRINVALTRAKSLMIVICNPITLAKDKMWHDFVKYCKRNDACAGEHFHIDRPWMDPNLKYNNFFNPFNITRAQTSVPAPVKPVREQPKEALKVDLLDLLDIKRSEELKRIQNERKQENEVNRKIKPEQDELKLNQMKLLEERKRANEINRRFKAEQDELKLNQMRLLEERKRGNEINRKLKAEQDQLKINQIKEQEKKDRQNIIIHLHDEREARNRIIRQQEEYLERVRCEEQREAYEQRLEDEQRRRANSRDDDDFNCFGCCCIM